MGDHFSRKKMWIWNHSISFWANWSVRDFLKYWTNWITAISFQYGYSGHRELKSLKFMTLLSLSLPWQYEICTLRKYEICLWVGKECKEGCRHGLLQAVIWGKTILSNRARMESGFHSGFEDQLLNPGDQTDKEKADQWDPRSQNDKEESKEQRQCNGTACGNG